MNLEYVSIYVFFGASLVAKVVKNLPAMWETQVRSLGWEDPMKKGMATHSSILAWEIPWTEEPGGLQSMGSQRVRHDRATNTLTYVFFNSFHQCFVIFIVQLFFLLV